MPVLPMFPLGAVLLPGMAIPLHVFEPRYRELVDDCFAAGDQGGAPEFGVALIERGSEVGGGDVRTDAGTVARIVEAAQLDDGRWYLVAVGMRRLRVLQWLADDPYPRAEIEEWPDSDGGVDADADAVTAELVPQLRRVLALRAELGQSTAPATLNMPDDPVLATWQIAAAAGLGPLDLHAVLIAYGATDRHALVAELLADLEEVLRAQLSS